MPISSLEEVPALDNKKITVIEGVPVYDVRAFYSKSDRAKYISHLDLYRTIQRAFQRAKLPIWYTQGFNPHIYLNFALPIALGYEGITESFDFRLNKDMDFEEVKERLNNAMPEGIVIKAVDTPLHKANDIECAEYELDFSCKEIPSPLLSEKLSEFFNKDTIETEKRTKKGPKIIDLKPFIFNYDISFKNAVKLIITLPAGTKLNINPTLLTDTFANSLKADFDYHSIKRLKILCTDNSEFI